MPLKDWSTTEASNNAASPYGAAEGWALSDINNTMRQVMADVRTLAASDIIASATTTDLGTKDSTFLTVSGVTTITGLGTVSAGIYKFIIFSGALTLTHNGTSLILPGAANITTVAGDTALFLSLGSGNWKCMLYQSVGRSLLASNNLSDVASAATARTNLGLGTATESLAGLVELATQAEAEAGVDDTVVMTALKSAAAITALTLGSGQTYQYMAGSRSNATTYQNTTGKPILVCVSVYSASGGNSFAYVSATNPPTGNAILTAATASGAAIGAVTFIVPNNHYYQVSAATSISSWWELRA